MAEEFWKRKSLSELDQREWEALCDGCGLCCLHKVEDEDTGDLYYTNLACHLLDTSTCRCTDYANRARRVADCLTLSKDSPEAFEWLPKTCAYRLRSRGEPLPGWHPLVTGDPDSVHAAGVSVRGRVLSERDTDEWTELWTVHDPEEG